MVEFTVHTPDTAPQEAQALLEQVKKHTGFIPNVYGVLAESPQALAAYQGLSEQFGRSSLSTAAKHVVWLTASERNGCRYCVAAHSAAAAAARVGQSVIDAIRHEKPIDDPQLEAVRQFTASLVDDTGWVSEDKVQAFLDAGHTRRHVLDIITGVAQKTLSNYTNHLAHTPLDEVLAPLAWTPA
ncbi:carboxymuconolactone decarboxylase family protein [Metapseudomonas otitidis]